MTVKIGTNPIAWTNDDMPNVGNYISLERCLTEGKEAGYSGFELGNKFPKTADKLNSVLKKHQLSLVSGWYSGQLLTHDLATEIKNITPFLQLLKSQGAKVMVYCEVTDCIHGAINAQLSCRPTIDKSKFAAWAQNLSKLAQYTNAQGVQLAYHHHMGTVVQTFADIERLMELTTNDVGLLLDTGHLTFAGVDPLAVYKKYHTRINHIHCKDVRKTVLADAINRNLSFLEAVLNGVFSVPGDGDVDFLALFEQIKDTNYQGWLVVEAEQDPEVANPLEYATKGYQTLVNLCRDLSINVVVSDIN